MKLTFYQLLWIGVLDLARFCAAPGARLNHFLFESVRAFQPGAEWRRQGFRSRLPET